MLIDQSLPMVPDQDAGGPHVVPLSVPFQPGIPVAVGATVMFGAHEVGAPHVVILLVVYGTMGVGPYQRGVVGVAEGMSLHTRS